MVNRVSLYQTDYGKYALNNLLVNPGFEVWQRGAGPFTAPTNAVTADEWQISAALFQVSRSSSPKYGTYCMSLDSLIAPASLLQGVENANALEGRWVTFSCWVRTSHANCARLEVDYYDGSTNAFFSPYHSGGGDWELLTVVVEIGTGLTGGPVNWHGFLVTAGFNFQTNVSTGVLMDGASLVVGEFPQGVPFIPLNPAEDMQRCQRFYQGDQSGTLYQETPMLVTPFVSSGSDEIRYPVHLYDTPTLTLTRTGAVNLYDSPATGTGNTLNDEANWTGPIVLRNQPDFCAWHFSRGSSPPANRVMFTTNILWSAEVT